EVPRFTLSMRTSTITAGERSSNRTMPVRDPAASPGAEARGPAEAAAAAWAGGTAWIVVAASAARTAQHGNGSGDRVRRDIRKLADSRSGVPGACGERRNTRCGAWLRGGAARGSSGEARPRPTSCMEVRAGPRPGQALSALRDARALGLLELELARGGIHGNGVVPGEAGAAEVPRLVLDREQA